MKKLYLELLRSIAYAAALIAIFFLIELAVTAGFEIALLLVPTAAFIAYRIFKSRYFTLYIAKCVLFILAWRLYAMYVPLYRLVYAICNVDAYFATNIMYNLARYPYYFFIFAGMAAGLVGTLCQADGGYVGKHSAERYANPRH